jgi:YesN/AraC family two-component response regulator
LNDVKKLKELTKDLVVLYVEDDLSLGKTMLEYLNKFFSSVIYATDGLEGLEAYKLQKFDLVITDLFMPKMKGLDMLKEIKSINKNQLSLITTAHTKSSYLIDAFQIQTDGYIIKPFDYIQLNRELFKIAKKLKKKL